MSIHHKCSVCNESNLIKEQIEFAGSILTTLSCNHSNFDIPLTVSDDIYTSFETVNGRKLMPFQIDGIKFAEESNFRCLIADEQGLGKTVQADVLLSLHKDVLFPAVLVTKSTIKIQHMWEAKDITRTDRIQVIFSGKEIAVPGFDIYITSYDMLKEEKVWAHIQPATLILDECQKIKNHNSGRGKAAIEFSKRCKNIIGLSGTPITNHAGEYFGILHILKPELFPDYRSYLTHWCDHYETAYGPKVGGLLDPEGFREYTSKFIIRRTQKDVLPDLFAKRTPRQFHHVELDVKINKQYEIALKELEELYYRDDNDTTAIIAIMTRMRQMCGVSKTLECSDYIDDFTDSTERKLAVFAHHHIAVNLLEEKANKILLEKDLEPCVVLRAGDDSKQKLTQLDSAKRRVIICSGIAAGEGMDGLQHICNDMIMLERQWNPAIEEQIESRLIRYGQKNPVNIIYMIATGKIDDYFTELVEQKRAILSSTLDGQAIEWNEAGLLKELTEKLISSGKRRWSI